MIRARAGAYCQHVGQEREGETSRRWKRKVMQGAKADGVNNLTQPLPLSGPQLTPPYPDREQSWQPIKSGPRASEASER